MPAEGRKTSGRDETLIRVLERLAAQTEYLGLRLDEAEKRLTELFLSVERAEPRQNETNSTLDEMKRAAARSHSGIVGLASGQESMDRDIKAIVNRQEAIASRQTAVVGTQERVERALAELETRFGAQEKTARDHLAFSIGLEGTFGAEMTGLSRHISGLHADAEKYIDEAHGKTRRQMEGLNTETMRRLTVLDGVEAGLRELLRRTEPPEPLWIVRRLRQLRAFARTKISALKSKWKFRTKKPGKVKPGKAGFRFFALFKRKKEKSEAPAKWL